MNVSFNTYNDFLIEYENYRLDKCDNCSGTRELLNDDVTIIIEDRTLHFPELLVLGCKGVGGDYTKSPKNKSSNRTFPMLPQLEEALKQRKILIAPLDSWYIFTGINKKTPLKSSESDFNGAFNSDED